MSISVKDLSASLIFSSTFWNKLLDTIVALSGQDSTALDNDTITDRRYYLGQMRTTL